MPLVSSESLLNCILKTAPMTLIQGSVAGLEKRWKTVKVSTAGNGARKWSWVLGRNNVLALG